MPRSPSGKRRVAALSVLMVALGGGCSDTRTRSETASAAAEPGRAGTAGELCLVGRATAEGVECQAFRAAGGGLYTLVGNLGGLGGDDACVRRAGRALDLHAGDDDRGDADRSARDLPVAGARSTAAIDRGPATITPGCRSRRCRRR